MVTLSLALLAVGTGGTGGAAAAPAPSPFGLDAPVPAPTQAPGPAPGSAPGSAPDPAAGSAPSAVDRSANLKHLPAGPRDLAFRGEMTRRSFSVQLTRGEVEQTKVFQLAFKNAVAALPERSNLQVSVNGRLLATIPTRSPNAVTVVPVAIPRGVLQPGDNRVDLSVAMAHRVDCSVGATFELWTEVDPVRTGFVVPAPDFGPLRSMGEIAGEALAEDGTFRIALRASQVDGPAAIARAGRLVDALVRRAGIARPTVQVGTEQPSGPGLDVIFAPTRDRNQAMQGLQVVMREDGFVVARSAATGRLALVVLGASAGDLDAAVAAFDAGPAAARRAPEAPSEGQGPRTFAELGLPSIDVVGRRYSATIPVTLPPDFFPTGHEKARLSIDGAYAPDIDADSGIAFRVNGRLVSSLVLAAGRDGLLQRELVELPLSSFHPGHNEIAMDAVTTTAADRRCDVASPSNETRLSIAGSSDFEMPHMARLGTSPQIPAALSNLAGDGRRPLHLYLADAGRPSVGSGLTVLANMAAAGLTVPSLVVHLAPPAATDAAGLLVAPWASLPPSISSRLKGSLAQATTAAAGPKPAPAAPAGASPGTPSGSPAADASPQAQASRPDEASDRRFAPGGAVAQGVSAPQGAWDDGGRRLHRGGFDLAGFDLAVRGWAKGAGQLLERRGFFYGQREGVQPVPFTPRTLLVAAVDQGVAAERRGNLDLPRVALDSDQWLVVTASDDAVLRSGLDQMTSDSRWSELQGQAVSLDVDKRTSVATQPGQVRYVLPTHIALADVRPILGGIVSDNIVLSLFVLAFLMSVLGASTYGLIRRAGVK